MITLTRLTDLAAQGFDTIIDARAPLEYAEDHLPGAINLPVLDDAERARVGTIYKQESPFAARKIGAALVARNAAAHIERHLMDKPGGWRPLVYCWRGGQRSGSFALILSQIGWRVETLQGGYKAWRRLVLDQLYETPVASPVRLLDGNTGTAKTAILGRLKALGHQVIDLEGLANHRGSLFGALGPQPAQTAFETRLALALATLDPTRPVVIEAESAKIGELRLPPRLWQAMAQAPRLTIEAPVAARAAYLSSAYADITEAPARLAQTLDALRPWHARETLALWHEMAATGAFAPLAEALMRDHYDPRYQKHRERHAPSGTSFATESLTPEALDALAARIAATF